MSGARGNPGSGILRPDSPRIRILDPAPRFISLALRSARLCSASAAHWQHIGSASASEMSVASNDDIYFYGHASGPHKYMSNFFPAKFRMSHTCIGKPDEAFAYPTAEHAIMHLKARLMGDESTADKILSAEKPLQAKRLGRTVKPWNESKWTKHVGTIAHEVLLAKFSCNDALAHKLRETKGRVLAEASPRDKIWGIGLGAKKAKAGEKWKGKNLLGFTLMKVRDAL